MSAATITTINVSSGGAEYVSMLVTETTGKDISDDTVLVAFMPYGRAPAPADWTSADVVIRPVPSQVQVKHLVSSGIPGDYVMWAKVADSPEIVPLASPEIVRLV